jgi:phospholipid/cholesterol/gamma-HCH transport system substrate-binding protein
MARGRVVGGTRELMVAKGRNSEVRVGIFVTALVLLGGLMLFVVGGSVDLLRDRYTLRGKWTDVQGLVPGATVRLAGFDVGEVANIQFNPSLSERTMDVEMKIMSEFQPRIRGDSVARIDSVGVLGDKIVSISMGNPDAAMLIDGALIETEDPLDLLANMQKMSGILDKTHSIGRKVDLMLGQEQEAAKASLARSFDHLEVLLNEAQNGGGLVHAMVYDKALADSVRTTVHNLEVMSSDLRTTTHAVRHGDGIAHELIYGEDGRKLASELSQLADALTQLTRDVKNEDSLVHGLIYDPSKQEMLDDLAATAHEMRTLSEAMNRGDGTLGLLVNDPALYEDMRALVGGAQRNKLLRAYIRKTVEQGEATNASPWEPAD